MRAALIPSEKEKRKGMLHIYIYIYIYVHTYYMYIYVGRYKGRDIRVEGLFVTSPNRSAG